MDLAIDTVEDLLIVDGELVFVRDAEAIAQSVRMRLATWLGETPYNTLAGVPYLQVIFSPNTTKTAVLFILQQQVLATPGVISCQLDCTLDSQTREIAITGSVTSINGPIDFTTVLIAP